MRSIKLSYVFASLFAAVWCGRGAAEAELLTDVLNNWEKLENAGTHLDVSFTLRHPSTSNGIQPLPQSGKFFIEGNSLWTSCTSYTAKPPQPEVLIGKNKRYAFTLSRKSSDDAYILTFLGRPDKDFDARLFQEMNDNHGCTVPWSAQFKPLRVWLGEPGFTLIGFRKCISNDQKDVVYMDCSYRPPDGGKNQWFSRMTVCLNADNHYRVESYEADIWSGKAFGKVEYGPNDGDLPVPIRNTISFTIRDEGDKRVEWICDYHEWKYRKSIASESRIGLSVFGLPEPMGFSQVEPPSRLWLWLLEATISVSLLAVLFVWLKRRHAIARPVKS